MCLRGKKKRLNKERNPSDPWDDIIRLCAAGVSVGQRQNEAENITANIMLENFPNLMKYINLQI